MYMDGWTDRWMDLICIYQEKILTNSIKNRNSVLPKCGAFPAIMYSCRS